MAPALQLSCFPNPAQEMVTVTFSLPEHGMANLELVNWNGNRIMLTEKREYSAGQHMILLPREGRSGMYLLVMNFQGRQVVKKLFFTSQTF
jgi:hypothetical protein